MAGAVVVLVIGLLLSAALATHQLRSNQRQISTRLDALADSAATDLKARFGLYEYGLRGARGAVISAGDHQETRAGFLRYARSREIDREFPGARGFGYIARVPRGSEEAFVAAARADGFPDFGIRYLSRYEGERFIIKYIEPVDRNRAAVGLDIGSEKNRRQAALASAASGRPTLTGPITLVQATGQQNRSMLLLLPVYAGDAPAGATGMEHTLGWVYAPLVTDEILADFEQAHSAYGFTLQDVTDPEHVQDIFQSSLAGGSEGGLHRTREVRIFGRVWRVDLMASPAFVESLGLVSPGQIGATGALFSLLLALAVYLLMSLSARKRRSQQQQARTAAIVDSVQDAIIATTSGGRVIEWNRAAERMFGYPAQEAMGAVLADLIVPPAAAGQDAAILRSVAAGQQVEPQETQRRHRDGTVLDVEVTAAPIREGSRVEGIATTLRDVAERVRSRREVLRLNAGLERQVAERTRALQETSALQQATLSNAGFAIIATDSQDRVTLFNPAAARMLGMAEASVVDRRDSASFLFCDGQKMGFGALLTAAPDQAPVVVRECDYLAADGERIPVLLTITELRTDDGRGLGYLGIAADLRELRRSQQALQVNETKLRGLFELSPLGIVLTDQDGCFVEFNEAFRAITGYTQDELTGMDYRQLTRPEGAELQREATVREQLQGVGRYGPFETTYLRKDGRAVPVRLNGVAMHMEGRVFAWSILEDISSQREVETALREAAKAAEAASRAKGDFLANMSHEIRTPMNSVLGMLQLIQRTDLDARQRDYLGKAETGARALLAIINDILDFSKIESGHQELELHEFAIEGLFNDLAAAVAGTVGDKDVDLVFDVDERIPRGLLGDSVRLQQVLVNLAGNAVKFTQVGEVLVRAVAVEAGLGATTVRFEVRDTGIGIAPAQLDKIFEGFTQAEASTNRRFGGTGLGLAISRRLVAMMGGQLEVESELGRGSCFHFQIELQAGSSGAHTIRHLPEALAHIKALVVDDNAAVREAVCGMTRTLGWEVQAAASGEQALVLVEQALAAGRPFEAIFLDWRMPGLDGWQTAQRIRALMGDAPASAPLIVMVTAHGREALAARTAQDEGTMDGFVVKPVTTSLLVDALADTHAARVHGRQDGAATLSAHGLRLAGLRLLVVEDNLANQQVARALLEAEGAAVHMASGGLQALEMLRADRDGFDLVITDIQMPDLDGYETARRIRGELGLQALPIVAMTANVLASAREACFAAGMNAYVSKPFDLDLLVATIRAQLGVGTLDEVPAVAESPIVPESVLAASIDAGQDAPTLDWQRALARFGGDRQAFSSTLGGLEGNLQLVLADLEVAVRDNDRDAAALQLHTLKGVTATFGAMRLSQMARAMEMEVALDGEDWRRHVDLQALRDQTVPMLAQAQAALAELAPASRGTPEAVAAALDVPALEALLRELRQSRLDALSDFAKIGPSLRRYDPEQHARIDQALARMEFQEAAEAVTELLEELKRRAT
ncbi:PAS domain S-box protein [Pseudoxanthomonas sp. JBR18]|uniref:CHASE domain-containing hybrid sensor histidine kinase/response regulator n=1 Tax=Pseudoxanthomonas sp. JBR18 TaxID=2969308 RepID=UPI002304D2F8|nr:PAS domain S-box protein [Pseudoxanthomonas sp. JBR18]WCE02707.1 PAS domain S-box protein [Pseudoxanthomonas sp. JBR18]